MFLPFYLPVDPCIYEIPYFIEISPFTFIDADDWIWTFGDIINRLSYFVIIFTAIKRRIQDEKISFLFFRVML